MDMLSKFEKVEVKAESRISESDKKFCEATSAAYERAIPALLQMARYAEGYIGQQRECMKEVYTQEEVNSSYGFLWREGFDAGEFRDRVMTAHRNFVTRITEYFASTYKVTLSSSEIIDALIPEKPEFNDSRYNYNWRSWTDAQREEYEQRLEAHKKEIAEWQNKIYALRIPYTDILDMIFTQLGGFSFQDKAVNELKEAAHKAAWNRYQNRKCYEQKKAVITFSYGCSWSAWYSSPHIELHNDMKDVILALSHFEFGTFGKPGCYGLGQLLNYSFDEPEYKMDYLSKLKSVKCFKNGRVDIRFQSEAYARQFAEEYLGLVA